MNLELEIKFIEKFVLKNKQSRYIQFVSSLKNRKKFLLALPHFRHFKWELLEEFNGNPAAIINRLSLLGIKENTCYVISENVH